MGQNKYSLGKNKQKQYRIGTPLSGKVISKNRTRRGKSKRGGYKPGASL